MIGGYAGNGTRRGNEIVSKMGAAILLFIYLFIFLSLTRFVAMLFYLIIRCYIVAIGDRRIRNDDFLLLSFSRNFSLSLSLSIRENFHFTAVRSPFYSLFVSAISRGRQ